MLMPSYPPKFYSEELLVPGFTGTVQDIGLFYTDLRLDQGPRVMFPNSIVIQGAVISHDSSERWVRTKVEVPPTVDPAALLIAVRDAVERDEWVVGKKSVKVYVNTGTLASYVISVDALCAGSLEEPPRSALYIRIRNVVASMTPNPNSTTGTGQANLPLQPPSPAGPPAAVGQSTGGGSNPAAPPI
jgi:small-conductance mechanosensitive channel